MPSSTTLAETVADALRDAILGGAFRPGERVKEIVQARELNVSQNTVRDALRLLEAEGWVVKRARRGVVVRPLTRAEASETYRLIAAVEGVALAALVPTVTHSRLLELRRHLRAARRGVDAGDTGAAVSQLFAFHLALVEGARLPLTTDILARLYNYVRLLEGQRAASDPDAAGVAPQLALHEALWRHLDARDVVRALDTLGAIVAAHEAAVLTALDGERAAR